MISVVLHLQSHWRCLRYIKADKHILHINLRGNLSLHVTFIIRMSSSAVKRFHWGDYLVFASMLIISMAIGIYHSCAGGRNKTTSEYLMGSRQMALIPTMLSLMVSFMSSILLLGVPAEMYLHGAAYWLVPVGTAIASVISAYVFIPVFYPLKITSINQYLQRRYKSKLVKYIGCFCAVFVSVFYTANVFFGPSTAIEAVSGFPAWASILIASVVSVIYTTLGGIRGVIWTNVFQTMIMIVGVGAIVIMGSIKVGGLLEVFRISSEWGRMQISFDPNPTVRLSFWSVVFGHVMIMLGFYGYNQTAVQRFSAMSSMTKAKLCVIGVIPGGIFMQSLASISGLTAFAYYTSIGCDPMATGKISNPNQIVPYFVMDIFNYPGIPGLLMAGVSAASLGTASSNLNSAAANAWGDIFSDLLPGISETRATMFTRFLVLVLGCLSTAMAFGLMQLGGTVTQMLASFNVCMTGPLGALFIMGVLLPWVNWKGATISSFISFAIGLWISFGSYSIKSHIGGLPTTTENCSVADNFTSTTDFPLHNAFQLNSTVAASGLPTDDSSWLHSLYSLSFLLMQLLNTLLCIFLSIIISSFTGFEKPEEIDPDTIHPYMRQVLGLKGIQESGYKFVEMRENIYHDKLDQSNGKETLSK